MSGWCLIVTSAHTESAVDTSACRNITCHVVLKLSHAVPACELWRAAASALQHAGDEEFRATLVGDVERVGGHETQTFRMHLCKMAHLAPCL